MPTTIINHSQFPIADALWTLIKSQPANVQDAIEKKFLERRKAVAAKKVSAIKVTKGKAHESFLDLLKNIPLSGVNVPGDEDGKVALIDEKYQL